MYWVLKDLNKRININRDKTKDTGLVGADRSSKGKGGYAAPIVKNDPVKDQQSEIDKEYEMALFRFRRKLDVKADFTAGGSNDLTSVGQSDGDDKEKQNTNNVRVQESKLSHVCVVNSMGFTKIQTKYDRENDPFYKEVDFIQTGVRHRAGKGISYDIRFLAPLNDTSAETAKDEINYNFKEMGDDLWLLEQSKFEEYCRK